MLKIHHLPRSRSARVVWQCEEMGVPYELAPVAFPPGDDYRALNPMGAIPYLEDGDVGMNESIAMMLYIAERYGPTPIWPKPADPAYPRAIQCLIFGEATIGMWGNVVMLTKLMCPEDQKQNWTAQESGRRVIRALGYAADMLGDREFIAGDSFTLADISIGYGVGVARTGLGMAADIPPALLAYQDRLKERPAFQRMLAAK